MEGNKEATYGCCGKLYEFKHSAKDPTQASRSLGNHRLGYSCEGMRR